MTIEATISFESVYQRDPQEWRDDTWTLYREFAREVWNAVVTGFEGSDSGGLSPDWALWTPDVVLNGNVGRLAVSCPGSTIDAIRLRQTTQLEFQEECTFTP